MTYNFKKIAIIIGAAMPFIATNVNAKPLNSAFKLGGFPTKQATFDNKKKEKEQITKTDIKRTTTTDGTTIEVITTTTYATFDSSTKTIEETIITKPGGEKSISIKTDESSREEKSIVKDNGDDEITITNKSKTIYPDGKIVETTSTKIETIIHQNREDEIKINHILIKKTTHPNGEIVEETDTEIKSNKSPNEIKKNKVIVFTDSNGKKSTYTSSHESSVKVEKIIE